MTKINSEIKDLYRNLRKQAHTNHCTINQSQTTTLIAKAQEIDAASSNKEADTKSHRNHHHLHIHRHHHRPEGEAALKRLYSRYKDQFDSASQALLKSTVGHRASSNPGVSPLGTHRLSASNIYSPTVARPSSSITHNNMPIPSSNTNTVLPMPAATIPGSTTTTTVLPMPVATMPGSTANTVVPIPTIVEHSDNTVTTPIVSSSNVMNSSNNAAGVILDFHSKPTWLVHWFPQMENRANDATNNLYAKGGALDKLDAVSGKNARDYEYSNHRVTDRTKSWWGHCNNAAEIACLLQPVKHSVTMKGNNGQVVKIGRAHV